MRIGAEREGGGRASETVVIEADLQNLTSYDGGAESFILDGGDYWFTTGNGSHEAVNNVLAAQGYETAGDAANAQKWTYSPDGGVDTETFGVTRSGVKVANHLDSADFNTWAPDTVAYLSRADWAGTWPKTYSGLKLTEEMLPYYGAIALTALCALGYAITCVKTAKKKEDA